MPTGNSAADRPPPTRFQLVRDPDDIRLLCGLAREIWTEHYTPVIGAAQVAYMLDRFQSVDAVTRHINDGAVYALIRSSQTPVGYLAYEPRPDHLFLSKLYVGKAERGRGHARRALDWIRAREPDTPAIELTVNRHNHLALAAYHRLGFKTLREQKVDIGHGFYMDDLVLRLEP